MSYIEREAAIKRFNFAVLDCLGMEPTIRAGDIIKALESIPAADVRPVARGKWIQKKSWTRGVCSACSWEIAFVTGNSYNFCPNCGAKMEES